GRHTRIANHGNVGSLFGYFRFAYGHSVVGGWLRALDVIEGQVLQENDRVVISYGGTQQALGIGRSGRGHDFEAGDMREPDLQILRVRSGELLPTAAWSANHKRDGTLSPEHGVDFSGVVHDLVHCQDDEVDSH